LDYHVGVLIFRKLPDCLHDMVRLMEYRGIMYAIRARPGRDEWTWTIYANDGRARSSQFTGTRDEAIAAACRKIDSWLAEQTRNVKNSKSEML
jgi:hypothetical protein